MTITVAIYAAVVATGGLAWQVWTYQVRRRPKIILTVRHGAYTEPGTALTRRAVYQITVTAVNAGETTETIEAIGIEDVTHSHGIDERSLSEPLTPGHTVTRRFELFALPFNPALGFVPFVEIASQPGKAFGEVDSLIADLAEDWNCWPAYTDAPYRSTMSGNRH